MSGGEAAAAGTRVVGLRRRSEFLSAARGARLTRDAFVLQSGRRPGEGVADEIGIGITVTRKIGNAVVRNRARRRLRHALLQVLPGPAAAGRDYVVVARPGSLRQPFAQLAAELSSAFERLGRRPG